MKVKVRVTPNSKINKIVSFENNILFIKISKPPILNNANSELIEFLEKTFLIKGIKIIYGHRGKDKLLDIPIDENIFLKKLSEILK
jgi:uncharacterized protein (TIGR00251 family)